MSEGEESILTPMPFRGDKMDEAAVSRDHVGSLDRGLAVMEILARHPSGMTLTEMAEEAGLTRA
ncbi:helix-turn-helix domain-containing protein, partial [Mesorhizobium sp. M7A.F.Ca.CA.004.02.1.1]|uniref:helix-turn-helix domain-containing protein n=1 Tax=Mesorhizobium sp. M7A.F.Ca.CA.004.02.1.1 TaxID=2496690 RepID=UPI001FE1C141